MDVPFLNLKLQHAAIREELLAAIGSVIDETAFAGGPFVKKFEDEFAAFCGARHAIAVGNGTDALWAALLAFGIGPGDEVITVPNTFIATAEAVSFCGGRPVFVDISEATYTLDPGRLEDAITERTKAIIPVHLYGQAADMDPIMAIARRHNLVVIEDCCQAHGATYKGRAAGTIGDAGCFSFYPGKNLGACGEAGAVITGSDDAAAAMRMFREHGQPKKYCHKMIGWNCRMDGMQAAILSVKLRHLDSWIQGRRTNAWLYDQLLAAIPGIALPREAAYARHVYHLYCLRAARRDELIAHLAARGITAGIHYPVPLHLTEAYSHLGWGPGSFPVSEAVAAELVSLPMFPELTAAQIAYVVRAVADFYGATAAAGVWQAGAALAAQAAQPAT